MTMSWIILLLCSLLTPPPGFFSSVAKADKDLGDLPIKCNPKKVHGGLLGGNLLSGLLGKDCAVGRARGTDGVVGSLLGGNGLLDKDGVLGGLLGGDGVAGSLLDKDGVLGGLLGGDGVAGSLLDKDGVLGGLLGGDGVAGSLLDKDGVLGGLLGGDGVVGSLLDKGGVLGGLLGGDGVVGSLLDKDGVLGGLLGKDGLVDGLLDVVIDLLIGKNGLLGKNGLVSNLLGGNGGDLTGLKIVNNTLPKISLHSLPGVGHEVGFNTQLLVESTSALDKALCVQVEADVAMVVQDNWEARQNNDCKTVDINIRLRPKVPLLDQPLKRLLSDVLREVGCNIINSRLSAVNTLLGSRTPAVPLGALGDLPLFSIISGDAIQLDLNLLTGDTESGVVASTQGLPLASTQGPPLAVTLLLATGHPPQLSLSQRTLSKMLELVQGQGAFSLSITNSMVPDSVLLSTSALLPLIPQLAKILSGSLPLELRVRVADKPVVAMRDKRATATFKASIDIFSPPLQSSQQPLFSLNTDIVLNVTPSVSGSKLQTSLALDSIHLTRVPPRLNPLSISPLAEWLKQVLTAAYVPAINDALRVSVHLPSVLNTSLRNARVDITDADDSPDQTNLKRFCSGGPLTPLAA